MFLGRFRAKLDNGREIIERYPHEPKKEFYMGWKDLNEYLERAELKIVSLSLHIGGRIHKVPDNKSDYFVNMRTLSILNSGVSYHRGFGFQEDEKMFIVWLDQTGSIVDMEVRGL